MIGLDQKRRATPDGSKVIVPALTSTVACRREVADGRVAGAVGAVAVAGGEDKRSPHAMVSEERIVATVIAEDRVTGRIPGCNESPAADRRTLNRPRYSAGTAAASEPPVKHAPSTSAPPRVAWVGAAGPALVVRT